MPYILHYALVYWLIQMVAAGAVVIGAIRRCRAHPNDPIASWFQNRNNLRPVLMLLVIALLPVLWLSPFLLGLGDRKFDVFTTLLGISGSVCAGVLYGLAGILLTNQPTGAGRIGYSASLGITGMLMSVVTGLALAICLFFPAAGTGTYPVLAAASLLGLAEWAANRRQAPNERSPTVADETEVDTKPRKNVFLWLLIGLVPIPVYLIILPHIRWHPAIGFSALLVGTFCNLYGSIGSVDGIKNSGLRALAGLFLAGLCLISSWVVAFWQVFSHMKI